MTERQIVIRINKMLKTHQEHVDRYVQYVVDHPLSSNREKQIGIAHQMVVNELTALKTFIETGKEADD